MANITAADVNKLRQQTGAGMMDCKKPLSKPTETLKKPSRYCAKKARK